LRATLQSMSVVKINAITVPEGMGAELEQRFAARVGEVEKMPGFEGFELLRPTNGESRYFVYTRWASEEDFQAWVSSDSFTRGHAQAAADAGRPSPVAHGAALLEFEVVMQA
jgi:heme oxygenase (mycobilin-producing)